MNAETALDELGKKAKVQVDWRRTKIASTKFVRDHDFWRLLELTDEMPRYPLDEVLDGEHDSDRHRDRLAGRNRKQPYGRMSGHLGGRSFVTDHAPFGDQPASLIYDAVEKRLRGRKLDKYHASLLVGLRLHCAGKSIRDCNPATIRGLLTHLAEN